MKAEDDVIVTDERAWAHGQRGTVVRVEQVSSTLRLAELRLESGHGCEVRESWLRLVKSGAEKRAERERLEERAAGGGPAGRVARFVLHQMETGKGLPV